MDSSSGEPSSCSLMEPCRDEERMVKLPSGVSVNSYPTGVWEVDNSRTILTMSSTGRADLGRLPELTTPMRRVAYQGESIFPGFGK